MRAEVNWWRAAAERDLEAARVLLDKGFYESASFHCQQAAEKFIKAVLLARGSGFQRTHSSSVLVSALEAGGLAVPDTIKTICRKIDPHYMNARYPNGVGGPPSEFYDRPICSEALRGAEAIRRFAMETLDER